MPIHLVPLVVGGTIAVIGTSYAFKKFVYDPHLAPLVDAFLATRNSDARRLNAPVATHTSRRSIVPSREGLRRRHQPKAEDREEIEGLLLADMNEPAVNFASTDRSSETILPSQPLPQQTPIPRRPAPTRSSSDRPPRAHDAEIRSVIFKHPASPPPPTARSSAIGIMGGAGGITLMPDVQAPPNRTSPHPNTGPSTTFSFLSLSQASSPEVPTSMLDSMTSVMRGDVNARHGYESSEAEAFSTLSSPYRPVQTLQDVRDSGLGLNTVGDLGMSHLSPGRTSRSVISLSESEGMSDWEALSEARAGSA